MTSAKKRQKALFVAAFLSPSVLLYGLFVALPLIQSFQLSLYRWRGVSQNREFAGLENFQKLFQDDTFRQALAHNLWLFGVCGVVIMVVSLCVAHAMQGSGRVARLLRSVTLFPQVVSLVVVAILWMFIFNTSFGPLTALIKSVGLEQYSLSWLGDKRSALPSVGVAFLWYSVGFYIMLFAAALRQIPQEVGEAASLDGSAGFHRFRTVTWPMLWSVKRIAWIYVAINVMNVFALVYLMTSGGPDRSTEVMLTYLYEQAFVNSQFGYGTALATANFVIAMILALLVMAVYRRDPARGAS